MLSQMPLSQKSKEGPYLMNNTGPMETGGQPQNEQRSEQLPNVVFNAIILKKSKLFDLLPQFAKFSVKLGSLM